MKAIGPVTAAGQLTAGDQWQPPPGMPAGGDRAAPDDSTAPGILEAVWRYRVSSLLIVLAATVVAVVAGVILQGQVTVTARLALNMPDKDNVVAGTAVSSSEATFVRYVKQRAIFVTSERVLTSAARSLGSGETAGVLRQVVTAEATEDGDSINVIVRDSDAERAVRVATAVVAAYRAESKADFAASTKRALASIAATRAQVARAGGAAAESLAQLDVKANDIRLSVTQFGDGVSFVDPATVDAAEGGGLPVREAAVGLALGILLAAAVAWLRADRDRRIHDVDTVGAITGAPSLGEIARVRSSLLDDLTAMPSAGYDVVSAGVHALIGSGVLLVTGAGPRDGRTITAAQLAVAAARDGARVLLVDADPSPTGLSTRFEVGTVPRGLATVANQQAVVDECTYCVEIADAARLWILPAGGRGVAARPAPLPSGPLAKAILDMRARYDLVVVDAPPVADSPDAAVFARQGDGVVTVVSNGRAVRSVRRMTRQLETYGARVVGFVFTFAGASGFGGIRVRPEHSRHAE